MLYQTESTHFSLFTMYIGPCHKSSRRLDVEEQESNKPATVTLESPIDEKNVDPAVGSSHDKSDLAVIDSPPPYHLVCDS